MTFEIEVATNQISKRLDSGRQETTELCQMDSRRSLSEILNEGDIGNFKQEELTINTKVQHRLNGTTALHAQVIDTITEDDKENNCSSTMQLDSEKNFKSSPENTQKKAAAVLGENYSITSSQNKMGQQQR